MSIDKLINDFKWFCVNLVVAGSSAIVAKTITAPIDRTKLILQNQDSALHVISGKVIKYNGIIDCVTRIVKEQGVATLWRGNVMNITRYFPMQAFNFAFNGEFNNLFQSVIGTDTDRKAFFVKFLSGAVAGVCTHSIFFPLEMCNTRIALDMGGGKKSKLEREFYGMADCLKKIKGKDGIGGLYIGYPVSCVGTALYRGLYFALYDFVKNMWDQKKPESYYHTKKPPVYIQLALAQAASTGASLSIYPMDTISRRLMLDAGRPKELRLFTSPLQAIKVLYKLGGIPAFYKGGLVNCFRSFSGALILVFYDEIVYRAQLNKFITGCDNC